MILIVGLDLDSIKNEPGFQVYRSEFITSESYCPEKQTHRHTDYRLLYPDHC